MDEEERKDTLGREGQDYDLTFGAKGETNSSFFKK
jgi:hypothetical protein